MSGHRRHEDELPDSALAAQADQGLGSLYVGAPGLLRGRRARLVGGMDECAWSALKGTLLDDVRQIAAEDSTLGDRLRGWPPPRDSLPGREPGSRPR